MKYKEIDIEELENEYLLPDKMVDDEKLYLIKEKIKGLPRADINLLLLYLELGSYAKVAKFLNCSSTLIYLRIRKIRSRII